MKKTTVVRMCGLVAAALVTECGKKTAVDSVKLGEYEGVSYTPVPVEVTNEQVGAEVQGLLNEHAVETKVDRAAKEGDIVNTDLVGMKDGVAFEGGISSDYDLKLGSGSFTDGLEDGLIDAVKGQELGLNLTFLSPYPSNRKLAGQSIVFDVTVDVMKESKPIELNDVFIRENTESATADEYRKVARESLLTAAQTDVDDRKKPEMLQKVVDSSEVTVAGATADAYYNEQLSDYKSQAPQAGINLETMVSYHGSDLDTFEPQLRAISEEVNKQNLVAKVIADVEGIAIAEEDRDALAAELSYADKDNMVKMVGNAAVNNYILTEKVVPFIVDNAIEA